MTIEKVEAKVGYSIKKKAGAGLGFEEEIDYRDHESQIRAIEKTFEDAKVPIKEHASKKGVTAVEVLPILPDFKVRLFMLFLSCLISFLCFTFF